MAETLKKCIGEFPPKNFSNKSLRRFREATPEGIDEEEYKKVEVPITTSDFRKVHKFFIDSQNFLQPIF